jgi:Zn-dependent oligopeptidase
MSDEVLECSDELFNFFKKDISSQFNNILECPSDKYSFESILEPVLNIDQDMEALMTVISYANSVNHSALSQKAYDTAEKVVVDISNMIGLNSDLYRILSSISQNQDLDSVKRRSLDLFIRDMENEGVHIQGSDKDELESINRDLSALSTKFEKNIIDDKKSFFYHFQGMEDIKEIPQQDLDTASHEAKSRDLDGWVFTLSPPSYIAILTYCSDRKIREQFFTEYNLVATTADLDNRLVALDLLKLRKRKATILGEDNYAELVLKSRMANSTNQVLDVLNSFAETAMVKAKKEVSKLSQFSGLEDFAIWDQRYYSEKLLKEEYSIDDSLVKKYFPISQTIDGALSTAKILFGLEFKKINSGSYAEGVISYEVYEGTKLISYFVADYHTHENKQPGAWCNIIRPRNSIPIVYNVCNFPKSLSQKEVELSHDSVTTLFHELGHALHCIVNQPKYSNLSAFNTEWDFVELPSQIFENWAWKKDNLQRFAKNIDTGKLIDDSILIPLNKSRQFMQGNYMIRQNEFGLLDYNINISNPPESVDELDSSISKITSSLSPSRKPDNYKMYASFTHIFSGGYSAGYYSYLWALILSADAFARFNNEGVMNVDTASDFKRFILSPGAQKPASEMFRDFLGRDPSPDALLEDLGLKG